MRNSSSPSSFTLDALTQAAPLIKAGKVGVIPTDTIYGLVANALIPDAVARVYRLKEREPGKPCIVLIPDVSELKRFGISLSARDRAALSRVWPGAVSVILPCAEERFSYLHRGTKTLSFRSPADGWLKEFLKASGPLVAPSANPEGAPPARDVNEAKRYFGNRVDFYVDGGTRDGQPSTLVRYEEGKFVVLRQGAARVS